MVFSTDIELENVLRKGGGGGGLPEGNYFKNREQNESLKLGL